MHRTIARGLKEQAGADIDELRRLELVRSSRTPTGVLLVDYRVL